MPPVRSAPQERRGAGHHHLGVAAVALSRSCSPCAATPTSLRRESRTHTRPPKKMLHQRIESRRRRYSHHRLREAIAHLFVVCDEDGGGLLEPREVALLQEAVAEVASEVSDDAEALRVLSEFKLLESSSSDGISLKHFTAVLDNAASGYVAEELIKKLSAKAGVLSIGLRRELGRQIRGFFTVLDDGHKGYLDLRDVHVMTMLVTELSKAFGGDRRSAAEEFLAFEMFDTERKDGKVDFDEFFNHFGDFTKHLRLPKRQVIEALKEVQERATKGEAALRYDMPAASRRRSSSGSSLPALSKATSPSASDASDGSRTQPARKASSGSSATLPSLVVAKPRT